MRIDFCGVLVLTVDASGLSSFKASSFRGSQAYGEQGSEVDSRILMWEEERRAW
jgi:hypothetical protein